MYKIKSNEYNCSLFLEDDSRLIVLPSIFSYSLVLNKENYVQLEKIIKDSDNSKYVKHEIEAKEVSDTTIETILTKIGSFLAWVDEYSKTSKTVRPNNTEKMPEEILNHYINDVLIDKEGVSEGGAFQHIMALNSYYNYLAVNDFSKAKKIVIKPRMREVARDNTKKRTAVKYLTTGLRSTIYQNTSCLRDELLLRSMGEMGCRTKECQGFLVDDFTIGTTTYKGLKSLFLEMDEDESKEEFEYYLQGKYSKSKRNSGGESRMLYFHRDLLLRFKKYYENERPSSDSQTFFLNDPDNGIGRGTPITKNRASKVFAEVRDKVIAMGLNGELDAKEQMLEKDHVGHTLRHSFGTDKFYEFAQEKNIRIDDVTTTSTVYLAVASLMGHTINERSAPQTTKRYIRSCHIMLQFQKAA
jgi:integrase